MAGCLDVIKRRSWCNEVGNVGHSMFGGRSSVATAENRGTEGR